MLTFNRSLIVIAAALLLALAAACVPATASKPGEGPIGFHLTSASVHPRSALFAGKRKPTLRYRFRAARVVDLKILVRDVRRDRIVASWTERDARPGTRLKRSWNGVTRRGKAAKDGRYEFRVGVKGRSRTFAGRFRLHGHVFPVDGPHGTRGPIGDFGAPRNGGRVHEGFDITGACGTPLLVARGGKVAKVGYDPELYGNFVLINGRKTDEQYFYAHLIAPSPLRKGEHVKTGADVGRIGQTGQRRRHPVPSPLRAAPPRHARRPRATPA